MLDTNGDGEIAYSEFVAGCLDLRRDQVMQYLRVAFSIFDTNKDGYIDKQELATLLLNPTKADPGKEGTQATTGKKTDKGYHTDDEANNTDGAAATQESEDEPEVTKTASWQASDEEEEEETISNDKGDGVLAALLPDGATVGEILEELDTSQDGRISFEEFRAYLLRNINCLRGAAVT